tara:strand:- start:201 stop:911 length:711 start_codon:yes stop_codon:yes gene_type:complete
MYKTIFNYSKKKILEINSLHRYEFVKNECLKIKKNSIILDAGCGGQIYKKYCDHLKYKSQDLAEYKNDEMKTIDSEKKDRNYKFPSLDYTGNVWEIEEKENTFDAILCSEVFEHIPYPEKTIIEFQRLLKKGGKLILTTPAQSIRHFDPYYYYSGFSDRWFEFFLKKYNFEIISIIKSSGYYGYLATELARFINSEKKIIPKIIAFPIFFYLLHKKETLLSVNTTCNGYFIVAKKL